ncbi:hypothetical protein N5923_09150 [Erwiniaceae bacterium BAC15a-03b]|uniref:Uncharacterized protein n=1 Tax=Winslowiella arboricola TaxID=2978220 RepID=A0A9J6PJW3_9GAMM|nr:hypothetical protein [Winslowiella arboricola]MCU5773748.1 hypothetical protein [Winslowiella arboricola]MCU5777658.1 hypothetical protein [Winslowiella arboricola]
MHENILTGFELNAIEDTLLTRDYLAKKKRVRNIDDAVKYGARQIINNAWLQAEEIKRKAFNDGFETGLIYCIEHIVNYFNAVDKEHARLQAILQQEILDVMGESFRDNTLFLHVVIDWYKRNNVDSGVEVIISLPQHQKSLAEKLCAKLRTYLLSEPGIVFHPHSYYQVKRGDQLLQFDADEFTAGMIYRLVDNNEEIGERLGKISADALQKIHSLF